MVRRRSAAAQDAPAPTTLSELPASARSASGLPLEIIERQFDRVQALFMRIDSKINAVFAIVSVEMALASVALSGGDWRKWDILLPASLFVSAMAVALYEL